MAANRPEELQWRRLRFTVEPGMLDLAAFRAHSFLLIPPAGRTHMFRIQVRNRKVQYYVGAIDNEGVDRISSFFALTYGTIAEEEQPAVLTGVRMSILPYGKGNPEYFHPSFLRSVIHMPSSLGRMDMDYSVSISSARKLGKRRYSFGISILANGTKERVRELLDVLRIELREFRTRGKSKLRLVGGNRMSFRNDRFLHPFQLASFVGIPVPEKFTIS